MYLNYFEMISEKQLCSNHLESQFNDIKYFINITFVGNYTALTFIYKLQNSVILEVNAALTIFNFKKRRKLP